MSCHFFDYIQTEIILRGDNLYKTNLAYLMIQKDTENKCYHKHIISIQRKINDLLPPIQNSLCKMELNHYILRIA